MNILAGDIGGTHTRLMLAQANGHEFTVLRQQHYRSQQYDGLAPVVHEFLQAGEERPVPTRACFAVAGPVRENKARLTNLPWQIDADSLAQSLAIDDVRLLNDFEGIGYGIDLLGERDLATLQAGAAEPQGNRVVLGAGTGLGQCLLTWCGGRYQVHASEGGHADFAARNEQEIDLLKMLLKKQSRASYEQLLSGQGLVSIYEYLGNISASDTRLSQLEDAAAAISEQAFRKDELAVSALNLFVSIYGARAGDLALENMATGGVFIAGGIAVRNLAFLQSGEFMQAFTRKPPMTAVLESIPVNVILNPDAGLLGALACCLR